jgi:hypothetical protein
LVGLNHRGRRDFGGHALGGFFVSGLATAYRGDWLKVVRHVQVERYFVSRRYRTGAATIEPQQAVDAESHPMEVDRGLALPPMLQGLPLRDLSGELVEANGPVAILGPGPER